ncbi:MAG: hypothetical protein ACFFDQ_02820 [Candidatus Thorarchaeota archaeon]
MTPKYLVHLTKNKRLCLCLILSLIFVGSLSVEVTAQDLDEFPLGLFLHYTQTEYGGEGSLNQWYNMTYIVNKWISQEAIEVTHIFNNTDEYQYEAVFPDEFYKLSGIGNLWCDTTFWELTTNVTFFDLTFTIVSIENRTLPLGNFSCHHLNFKEDSDQLFDIELDLYYDTYSGILIETQDKYTNNTNPSIVYTNSTILTDSNFQLFTDYLIHTPTTSPPTTSTTTTTTTITTQPPTSSTSPTAIIPPPTNTNYYFPVPDDWGSTSFLLICISVEVVIIYCLIQKRRQS